MYSQRIVVTGGAGYVGSHFCKYAKNKGHEIFIIDNLSTGHEHFVKWGEFFKIDVRETEKINQIISKIKPNYVVHFAASAYVNESLAKPLDYIRNNIGGMESITRVCSNHLIPIIFSSSCSVYGEAKNLPINEGSDLKPVNPYGETKLLCEKILNWSEKAYKLKYVSLRYFNAAGADFELVIGEDHTPETHLIPLAIRSLDKGPKLKIFGNDYNSFDGTAIRDYIHVNDLASAHLKAIEYLDNGGHSEVFNLGSGSGTSIMTIINRLESITNLKINKEICKKREGDPSKLYADITKAKNILNWEPKYSNIDEILNSALNWHKKLCQK